MPLFNSKKLAKAAQEIGKKIMDVMPEAVPAPADNFMGGAPGQAFENLQEQPKQVARNIVGRQMGLKGDVQQEQIVEQTALQAGLPAEAASVVGTAVPMAGAVLGNKMSAAPSQGLGKVIIKDSKPIGLGKVIARDPRPASTIKEEAGILRKIVTTNSPETKGLIAGAVLGSEEAMNALRKQGKGRLVQRILENEAELRKRNK